MPLALPIGWPVTRSEHVGTQDNRGALDALVAEQELHYCAFSDIAPVALEDQSHHRGVQKMGHSNPSTVLESRRNPNQLSSMRIRAIQL